MAAKSDLLTRPGYAACGRVGLLTLVVYAATCVGSQAGDVGNRASGASGGGLPRVSAFPDARTYVVAHNAVRAAVQKPAGYWGPWEPLPPVVWSDDVAITAQAWAEHLRDAMNCKLMHSDTRYGENLAAGDDVDAALAVEVWSKERSKFIYSPQYAFEPASGHYSQVVWRNTTQIGCGSATCGHRAVVVCRYNPPGNYIGRAPY